MKRTNSLVYSIIVLSGIILIPTAFAENVPDWVKNTAGWWATDEISETEFVNAIEYLIKKDVIRVNVSQTSETSQGVPDWVKNTAGWWATDEISETEFVNAIEYLIKKGIISLGEECKFFGEEYNHLDQTQQKMLCKFSNFDFIDSWYSPYEPKEHEINTLGFRGDEFFSIKPPDTYRIFMVGGSTVFGPGVVNQNTIPSLLQNFYSNDKFDNVKQIEVINTGINGGISKHEADLIKNKLSKMSPDLIIVYDGWNDSKIGNYGHYAENWDAEINDVSWKNRWVDICNSYNKKFDVVIVLQPLLVYDKLMLTDQEFTNFFTRTAIKKETANLDELATHLNELNSTCNSAHDLRFIMQDVSEGVYYDQGHMTPAGNEIIAKKIYEITLPIIEKNSRLITSMNDEKIEDEPKNHQTELNSKVDYRGKFVVGTDFSEKNMPSIIAYYSTFKEIDFSSSNLSNMDAKFSKFDTVDFSNAQLHDSRISRTNFTDSHFNNADLSQSYLSSSMFVDSDLTNSSFENSDLRGVIMRDLILENTNFNNVDFSHSNLRNFDFTRIYGMAEKTALQNSKFIGSTLTMCILEGINFSILEIHGDILTGSPTEFTFCDMKYNNFSKISMSNIDFSAKSIMVNGEPGFYPGTDLSYSTFTDVDLRTTVFVTWAESQSVNKDVLDRNRNLISVKLEYVTFDTVNLRDSNLSIMRLNHSQIIDSDLTNVSFENSDLSFSSIINSDLSGANLSGANLSGVILDNTILTGANLNCINHSICESE